jgi:allantoicase
MTDFTELVDLAQERLGGAAVVTNDDFFASKDNLLKAKEPVFLEGQYTDRGKWMDGWESRRRRTPGHDWCIVRLGVPGVVHGVVVDTAFFKGNFPESCSIDACSLQGNPDAAYLEGPEVRWFELLARTKLQGDAKNRFATAARQRITHLRLNIFPDGGVARLRAHGVVVPDARWMGRPGAEVDLASVESGGAVVLASDMFFGSRHNLVMPGRGVNMGDGWETKRRRSDGPDWVIVKLAAEGTFTRVEVDTAHFKGNYPESCAIQVTRLEAPGAAPADLSLGMHEWHDVLARTKLQPHARHFYEAELQPHPPATHARFQIFPDGGVSRLRLWGTVSAAGREAFGIERLNLLSAADAERELVQACGARAWARAVAAARPFAGLAALKEAGRREWAALVREDILEAFRAHPRIGEKNAALDTGRVAARWSQEEQATATSTVATATALAEANRAYEAKFGHMYIVYATGKTADEMLALCKRRLANDAEAELRVAAAEQWRITESRLEKMAQG